MPRRVLWAAIILAILVAAWPVRARQPFEDGSVVVLVTLRDQPASDFDAPAEVESAAGAAAASPEGRDRARGTRTARLMTRMAGLGARSQAGVRQHASRLGGELVYAARAVNMVALRVPPQAIDELRARPDVASVEIDEPRHALLDHVGAAMLANTFWSNGVTGGTVDVAVIDTGVYPDHGAFAPRATSIRGAVFHQAAQRYPGYSDNPSDPDDQQGHGTFVAGMVFAQGPPAYPNRRGVAYGIDRLYNLKAGFRTTLNGGSSLLSDLMAAVDWALSQADPPEVFNYSYGADTTSDDDSWARYWDAVVGTFGKTVTISAGNSGPNAYSLGSPGIAYNAIGVANVDSRGSVSRADDVIAGSSSRGPTAGGRRKPDLAAPGTSINLPSTYGPGLWYRVTGTSFSSPAIAGAAALLIDAGVADPRAVKAVLINSADDLGVAGWDAEYGWGYYNGSRAWAERAQWRLDTYGAPGTPSGFRLFERTSAAPTRATLVWHRHVTYNGPSRLPDASGVLNDLDMRLYATADSTQRAASTSRVDNVEQVTSTASEPVVLVVNAVAPFTGSGEIAALAHSGGFVARSGPGIVVTLDVAGAVTAGTRFTVSATVNNPGDVRGHAYELTLTVPSGYGLVSSGPTQTVATLAPGQQAILTWTVQAPGASVSPQAFQMSGRMTAYGLSATASATATVTATPSCTYTVAPPATLPPAGGTASVSVSADPGCSWSASTSSGWLTLVSGLSGTGSGRIGISAPANIATVTRTATVDVAGRAVTVAQAGNPAAEPRSYYLAEGATGDFFTLDVAIANPNEDAAPFVARFLREDGSVVTRTGTVPALSRVALHVNAIDGLSSGAVSTVIESPTGLPLIVERTMSWTRDAYGAHGSGAVDGPRREWYFAEGAQGYFDTYLLLANPGERPATVTVTFLRELDGPIERKMTVAPTSRFTFYAGDDPELVDRAFSMAIASDEPVVAERAMYWSDGRTFWVGGHESAGVGAPAKEWFHAEGATGPYFDTYLLVGNPNVEPALLTIRYLLPSGVSITRTRNLPGRSRLTIDVEKQDPMLADTAVSVTISATRPVVSERSMYWPGTSASWQEAHNSFGVTSTALRWGLAEGCAGGTRRAETWVLLANPSTSPADVRVTFLGESGPHAPIAVTVPPTGRYTVNAGADVPALSGTCFGAIVESTNGVPIAVERALYWDARSVHWAAGTNATATPLR